MTKGITQPPLHKSGELTRQYWAQDTEQRQIKQIHNTILDKGPGWLNELGRWIT